MERHSQKRTCPHRAKVGTKLPPSPRLQEECSGSLLREDLRMGWGVPELDTW